GGRRFRRPRLGGPPLRRQGALGRARPGGLAGAPRALAARPPVGGSPTAARLPRALDGGVRHRVDPRAGGPRDRPLPGRRGAAMSRRARAYLAGCAAAIGYAIGYALPAFARLGNIYYDPIARRFLVGPWPGPIPMGYYGQVLWGFAGGLTAAGVTMVAT